MALGERITDSIAFTIKLPTVPPPPPPPPTEYCCEICGVCFSTQAELDAHIASEHPPFPWALLGIVSLGVVGVWLFVSMIGSKS